ncbi:MAG TPA: hypothetical protein VGD65_06795 [Chryseosolibacter sp.]
MYTLHNTSSTKSALVRASMIGGGIVIAIICSLVSLDRSSAEANREFNQAPYAVNALLLKAASTLGHSAVVFSNP